MATESDGDSNLHPLTRTTTPDHDGANNMAEYLAGTDPLSNQSVFKFINIQPGLPSGVVIQWSGVSGKSYSLERSFQVAASYTAIANNLLATNSLMSFYDPTATGAGPYFYRLKMQ